MFSLLFLLRSPQLVSETNRKPGTRTAYHLVYGGHRRKWVLDMGPPLGHSGAGKAFRLKPGWKWVGETGSVRADWLFSGSLTLGSPLRCPLCLQLPHMPHISECLMKRSLKPTDLRDMTIGQLQVIVNDLHSQIESKWGIC